MLSGGKSSWFSFGCLVYDLFGIIAMKYQSWCSLTQRRMDNLRCLQANILLLSANSMEISPIFYLDGANLYFQPAF